MKKTDDKKADLNDLVELMARLRAPDGCPWDRDQTPETLTPYIVEEAYELVEAIKEGDPAHVCEELGDLLFQIIFQAQIGREKGDYDISDVMDGIHTKMTRRHPHVFGNVQVENADEVRKNWVRIKEGEGRKKEPESALGKVPRSMPSLLRGRRLTENAATVGFDWPEIRHVLEKFDEEWNEFLESVEKGEPDGIEDEFGDVLFVMVNLSRFLKLDPEQALNRTIEKFVRRFRYIEKQASIAGRKLEDMTLEEMDDLWNEAKGNGI